MTCQSVCAESGLLSQFYGGVQFRAIIFFKLSPFRMIITKLHVPPRGSSITNSWLWLRLHSPNAYGSVHAVHACVFNTNMWQFMYCCAVPKSVLSQTFVLTTSSCRLQLCRAACPARQRTEVCSPPITRSARGWPTSATAATGCPPKSWRPRSASQTAPGASTIRYPDASVSRGCWGTASWTDGLTGKRGRAGWAVGTGSWGLRREESYGEDTD